MKKDERDAAFRMLDEHAAKERSEALDVEFAKAALLEDAGKSTEAIALLQLALERFPDHPGVRYQIALIQDKAGLHARVRAQLRKPAQGSARRRQPAERARLFAGRSQPETAARRNADPQGARGVARQSRRSSTAWAGCCSAAATSPARCRISSAPTASSRTPRSPRTGASCCGSSGKQAEARALWARSLARSPDSKPLRATIERLTGTKLDPPEPKTADAADAGTDAPEPDSRPRPTTTSS